ncbi:MAG: phosphatidylserine decarboxylase [Endomicrobiaceae bacterium]
MTIVKDGYSFILVPLAIAVLLLIFGSGIFVVALALIFFLLSAFCMFFFRDPNVKITEGEGLILSPCSGTVMEVKENDNGQSVIRVFLSVFDVHLQRSPVSGTVKSVEYKPGKFLKANEAEAHIVNEQNWITIENEKGIYLVKQIAGILARRCVSWVKPGDIVKTGDKIGLIKFSSQVDLHMPAGYDIKVKVGDKVVLGVTVFATILKNGEIK